MTTITYKKAVIHKTAFGSALAGSMAPRFYVQPAEQFQTLKEAKAWIDEVLGTPIADRETKEVIMTISTNTKDTQ